MQVHVRNCTELGTAAEELKVRGYMLNMTTLSYSNIYHSGWWFTRVHRPLTLLAALQLSNMYNYKRFQVWHMVLTLSRCWICYLIKEEVSWKKRGKEDLVSHQKRMLCTHTSVLRVHGEVNLSFTECRWDTFERCPNSYHWKSKAFEDRTLVSP